MVKQIICIFIILLLCLASTACSDKGKSKEQKRKFNGPITFGKGGDNVHHFILYPQSAIFEKVQYRKTDILKKLRKDCTEEKLQVIEQYLKLIEFQIL